MKPLDQEWPVLQKNTRFLLCSDDNQLARQLGDTLRDQGVVAQEIPTSDILAERLAAIRPSAVFLDFVPQPGQPGTLDRAVELARLLERMAPDILCIAVGRYSAPEGAVAALRAGVTDFVDLDAEDQVGARVRSLLRLSGREAAPPYRSLLVLGVRPGVGASTLVSHLAGIMQEGLAEAPPMPPVAAEAGDDSRRNTDDPGSRLPLRSRVGVLDLGVPVRDGLLYLNATSEFDFVEAARNLARLDDTLLRSALGCNAAGVTVLPMPHDLTELRTVSYADSLSLFGRMVESMGALVTDVGGLYNPSLIAGLAREADQTWLVADQSIGALVSLADILQMFKRMEVSTQRLGLVLNRYDVRYGMSATQISERFNLELRGTLPERTLQLRVSQNQGRLLHQDNPRDPYARGVRALANVLRTSEPAPRASTRRAGWLAGLRRRTGQGS
jgi:pilus assembly protein CpaE